MITIQALGRQTSPTTNKQQLLPNQILTGATNATVQDWQQFPNWVTEAGATLMGVVLTTIIIILALIIKGFCSNNKNDRGCQLLFGCLPSPKKTKNKCCLSAIFSNQTFKYNIHKYKCF
jgi:hypothetical protein